LIYIPYILLVLRTERHHATMIHTNTTYLVNYAYLRTQKTAKDIVFVVSHPFPPKSVIAE